MNHFYKFFFLHQNHIQVLVEFSQLSHKLHSQYGKLKFNKKDIVDINKLWITHKKYNEITLTFKLG